VNKYTAARKKVHELGGNVAKWITSVLASTFPFDPGGCEVQRLPQLQVCSLSSMTAQGVRRRHRHRKVVDICSGQQSLARYLLAPDSRNYSCGMSVVTEAVSAMRLACNSVGVLCIIFLSTS
jgi:triphosphoribosyl-dephospho-CoA synthetase